MVGGGKEGQEGRDICIPMANSCCCMAKTKAILQRNNPSIKNKLKSDSEVVYSSLQPHGL